LRKIHYNPITLTRKPSLEAALIALDIIDNEQITQKFFEHIEPKYFLKISGEGAQPPPQTRSSMGRGHPLPTLYPIGASNLASLALAPPFTKS